MNEQTIGLDLSTLLPGIDLQDDDCINRLQTALQNVEGIHRAHQSDYDSTKEICLHFDPSIVSIHDVQSFAEEESAKLTKRFGHAVIPIEGMDCSDCAFVLKHTLEHMNGVMKLDVSFAEQQVRIEFDSQQIDQKSIENRIRRLGYSIPLSRLRRFMVQNQLLLLSSIAGLSMIVGWIGEISSYFSIWLSIGLYAVAYALAGYPLALRSFRQIFKERRFDTDQLMLAAAFGAAILGEFAEGALLLFLFSLGHALEDRALDRARNAILSMAELMPKVACVRRGSEEEIIPVEMIQLNDLVIVPPGARIPVDGLVQSGSSSVDQSSITGESIPLDVAPSDRVFAGSVNGEGALELVTTRLSKDSTLSQVVQLVQDAQAKKSPAQRYSDRIIQYLVPAILVIDALLIIIPPIFGVPFRESFLMAMTLLVAASPCALALGTPSAILASIARAARSGVLIKGGAHLENLGNLQVVAFDKTGTLTHGTPKVTEVIPHPPTSENDLLSIAAAVESHSAHPLALAIVSAAKAENIDIPDVRSVRAETGVGIEAEIEDRKVRVGKIDSDSKTSDLPESIQEAARSLESQGKTVVQVSIDSTLLGIIALSDSIREEAPKTVRVLRELGIEKIIMLSGDNERAAFHIGKSLELDQVIAELMPEEKLRVIDELTRENTNVAMVGDGVNDAPALAAASTGIAMGGAKTHVALETADVVLMADDLSGLPFAIELSKKTRSIIRQNFIVALSVIIGLITLTLTNVAGITTAIALHEGTTLLVVFNALRLLRFRSVKASA